MSDFGLKIKNDTEQIQIDSTYTNFVLSEWGTSIVVSGSGTEVTLSSNSKEPPLVAIQPSSTVFCGVVSYLTSGELHTGFLLVAPENSIATVNLMVFVATTNNSSEQYGLRVYNTGGDSVYDSGFPPLLIQDIDVVAVAYTNTTQIVHPTNEEAYFITSPCSFIQHWEGYDPPVGSDGRYYLPMLKKVDNSTISFGGRINWTPHIPGNVDGDYGFWSSAFTVIMVKKAF